MNDLSALKSLGFQWPTPAYLFGAIAFGLVGLVAFRHGRRSDRRVTLGLGLVLMFYPYAVSNTVALYLVGMALCAGIWFDHR
jgi:MFS family permease